MSRRRKEALEVPASADEATALLAEYVEGERKALIVRLAMQAMIDGIAQGRDEELARLRQPQEARFLSLKAWWEAGGRELANDRRSTELAGAKIGIRLAPPKVKLVKGLKAEAVVAWLSSLRWSRAKEFLRTKVELDKQAIIKAAGDKAVERVLGPKGITVAQDDEFFIDAGLDEEAIRASIEAPQ